MKSDENWIPWKLEWSTRYISNLHSDIFKKNYLVENKAIFTTFEYRNQLYQNTLIFININEHDLETNFVTMLLLSLSYKTSLTTKPEKETIIQYKDESYLF